MHNNRFTCNICREINSTENMKYLIPTNLKDQYSIYSNIKQSDAGIIPLVIVLDNTNYFDSTHFKESLFEILLSYDLYVCIVLVDDYLHFFRFNQSSVFPIDEVVVNLDDNVFNPFPIHNYIINTKSTHFTTYIDYIMSIKSSETSNIAYCINGIIELVSESICWVYLIFPPDIPKETEEAEDIQEKFIPFLPLLQESSCRIDICFIISDLNCRNIRNYAILCTDTNGFAYIYSEDELDLLLTEFNENLRSFFIDSTVQLNLPPEIRIKSCNGPGIFSEDKTQCTSYIYTDDLTYSFEFEYDTPPKDVFSFFIQLIQSFTDPVENTVHLKIINLKIPITDSTSRIYDSISLEPLIYTLFLSTIDDTTTENDDMIRIALKIQKKFDLILYNNLPSFKEDFLLFYFYFMKTHPILDLNSSQYLNALYNVKHFC